MRSDLLQRKFILATFVILKTNSSVDGWDSAGGDRISTKTNSSDNNRESAGGSPTSYMPELPEVETIRRQLFKEVTGKRIKSVEIKLPKMVYFDGRRSDVKNFKKSLEGARITKADRAAKILIIELSNGYTLLIHLKLTGQLIYRAKDGKINRGGNPRTKRAEPRLGKSLAGLLFVSQSLCSWTNREQSSYNEPPWPKPNVSVPNKWTHAIIHFTV